MNFTTDLPPRTPLPLPLGVVQAKVIRKVYIWVLVGVGLPGNLATLVTIRSMQITTATFYVALLAGADIVALLLKLLFHQLVTHSKMTAASCVLSEMPTFFSCYSNWVLALICFERFFAVCFPLKKQVYFTKRRVYISAVVLTLALVVCFAPTPFLYSDVDWTRAECVERETMIKYLKDFWESGFVFILYFGAPFLAIAVFTTLIIIGLQRHRRAREALRTTATEGNASNDGSVERAISIMLLCAGLIFLLLMLPACLYHLFFSKNYNFNKREEAAEAFLFYQVITVLADTNHAVNFFIYFVSAAKFRKSFVQLLKRCFRFVPSVSSASDDITHLTRVNQSQEAKNTSDSTTPA